MVGWGDFDDDENDDTASDAGGSPPKERKGDLEIDCNGTGRSIRLKGVLSRMDLEPSETVRPIHRRPFRVIFRRLHLVQVGSRLFC